MHTRTGKQGSITHKKKKKEKAKNGVYTTKMAENTAFDLVQSLKGS